MPWPLANGVAALPQWAGALVLTMSALFLCSNLALQFGAVGHGAGGPCGGARGAPEGFYYRGKVYLMASKLNTVNDAARVLFHEALGHHGLRGAFGK